MFIGVEIVLNTAASSGASYNVIRLKNCPYAHNILLNGMMLHTISNAPNIFDKYKISSKLGQTWKKLTNFPERFFSDIKFPPKSESLSFLPNCEKSA